MTIVPMPELRVAAALGEQMTLALARVGFITEVSGPSWMASVEARRPSALVVVGPVELNSDSGQVLSASAQRALDLSALLHGSTPQVLAGVLEVEQSQDATPPAWRTLVMFGSSGAWPIASLLRRLPDGAAAPALGFDAGWQALDRDPKLRVWLSLARSATEHDSADLRVLQRATLLETIGKAILLPDRILRTPDGCSSRRPTHSRDRPFLHEWLFAVLQQALVGKPELLPAVLPRSTGAWEACGTWSTGATLSLTRDSSTRPAPVSTEPKCRRSSRPRWPCPASRTQTRVWLSTTRPSRQQSSWCCCSTPAGHDTGAERCAPRCLSGQPPVPWRAALGPLRGVLTARGVQVPEAM